MERGSRVSCGYMRTPTSTDGPRKYLHYVFGGWLQVVTGAKQSSAKRNGHRPSTFPRTLSSTPKFSFLLMLFSSIFPPLSVWPSSSLSPPTLPPFLLYCSSLYICRALRITIITSVHVATLRLYPSMSFSPSHPRLSSTFVKSTLGYLSRRNLCKISLHHKSSSLVAIFK